MTTTVSISTSGHGCRVRFLDGNGDETRTETVNPSSSGTFYLSTPGTIELEEFEADQEAGDPVPNSGGGGHVDPDKPKSGPGGGS